MFESIRGRQLKQMAQIRQHPRSDESLFDRAHGSGVQIHVSDGLLHQLTREVKSLR